MAATRTELAIYKGLAALLVVVVLAAVLWPVFPGRGRPYAIRTACLSNVKQIGTSTMIYMGDHDEWLPAIRSSAGPTAVGWAGRIADYTKNPDLFVDRVEIEDLDETERRQPRVSYALNANAADFPDAATRSPAHPDRSVLFYEVSGARQGRDRELKPTLALSPAGDGTADGILDTIDPNVAPLARPATGPLDNSGIDPKSVARHKGLSNFAFLDSHAKAFAPAAVSAGANAIGPKDPQSKAGCRRADLPDLPRPCAEGAANGTHPATFSLR